MTIYLRIFYIVEHSLWLSDMRKAIELQSHTSLIFPFSEPDATDETKIPP